MTEAMSNPHLLLEILDHIVDVIHNRPETLKKCCLVSKSWVPRTQKHLFCRIGTFSAEHLESWKKAFPGPSNSSAYHTHTPSVGCPRAFATTDAEGGLIQALLILYT